MQTTPPSAPPGWYADPRSLEMMRYFDGQAWTGHTAHTGTVGTPAPGVGSSPSDPVHWLLPTGRSWQSIAAGYLGLVSFFVWFVGPVAIAAGWWGLHVAKHRGGHGRGRSWFGIVGGVFGIAVMTWFVAAR